MSAPIRLSEFCAMITDTLKNAFQDRAWWILAEINSRNDKANYTDFELVEKKSEGNDTDLLARVQARAWQQKAKAALLNFEDITGKRPDKGMQVLLKVSVDFHPVYGIKLQVFDIDSQHMLGQIEMQRRKTIDLLSQKPGIRLFDGRFQTPNKSLELAPVVQRIAIITSASAAGYQDFTDTLKQNLFEYTFFCTPYFSVLQGENAAVQIKSQLLKIYEDIQKGKTYDAVVMIRGGGAQSDLLPFDDFNLAHAVARFPVPVITGIGHLKDESIVDMVAHSPTKTPTQAAEFIIDQNRSFEEEVEAARDLIAMNTMHFLNRHHRKLDHTGAILNNGTLQVIGVRQNMLTRITGRIRSGAQLALQSAGQKLGENQRNLLPLTRRLIEKQSHDLDFLSERIRLLNPYDVLKRGYAMVTKGKKIITSTKSVNAGDEIKIILNDGEIGATVNEKKTS